MLELIRYLKGREVFEGDCFYKKVFYSGSKHTENELWLRMHVANLKKVARDYLLDYGVEEDHVCSW